MEKTKKKKERYFYMFLGLLGREERVRDQTPKKMTRSRGRRAGMREMRGTQQTHKSYIYPNEVKSLTGNKRCEQRQDPERIAVWV